MKKYKVPSLVTVGILTAITVFFWIAFGVIKAFSNKETSTIPKNISNPLTPTLNEKAIENFKGRLYFEEP